MNNISLVKLTFVIRFPKPAPKDDRVFVVLTCQRNAFTPNYKNKLVVLFNKPNTFTPKDNSKFVVLICQRNTFTPTPTTFA